MHQENNFFADLNPEQREAASCINHCLTIAAPGSGKTKMLAAKAAYLLSDGKSVTAVTFTRDSAIELRERIIKQAGEGAMSRLLVGTFHSIDLLMANPTKKTNMGREILSQSKSLLQRPWVIAKESFRRATVLRAISDSGLDDCEINVATTIIEGIKSGQVKPTSDQEVKLVQTYTELMVRHGVIDFQDILLKTNEGIVSGEITPLRTDHLLLDEFQDTDLPQFEWAMHHAKTGVVVTAVGDDDQSIYGFRRALGFAGMDRFAENLKATKVVLGLNYRSHSEILAPAAKLIAVNLHRMDKALVAFKGLGGRVAWERFSNTFVEADACLQEIKVALSSGHTVGVLARTNKRLDSVESLLLAEDIPYTCASGDSILKYPEASILLAGLSCLVRSDPKDTDELLAWCGVDEDDLVSIHKLLGKHPIDWIANEGKSAMSSVALKDSSKSTLRSVGKRMAEWKCFVSSNATAFVVERVKELLTENSSDKRSSDRFKVLAKIFESTGEKAGSEATFSRKIDAIRRLIESPKTAVDALEKVCLLTAHSSKGLEFDTVWIIGAQEGQFPDDASAIQEERRLMYVAMTRARQVLWISASGKSEISRFVVESGTLRIPSSHFEVLTKKYRPN